MGELHKQYIVDDAGHKTAVVLPIDEYKDLMEDIHDLAVVAERKNESTLSSDELIKKFQSDGLI